MISYCCSLTSCVNPILLKHKFIIIILKCVFSLFQLVGISQIKEIHDKITENEEYPKYCVRIAHCNLTLSTERECCIPPISPINLFYPSSENLLGMFNFAIMDQEEKFIAIYVDLVVCRNQLYFIALTALS